MQFSKLTTAVVALALITLAAVGFAAIGAAAELDEIENTTVETTNETAYVELDVEFAETFENTSTEDVNLTIYNETEFDENGTDATPVLEDSFTGSPGETLNNQYNLSDTALEGESEYRAIVTVGNEANVESGYVAADDESVGGGFFGDADESPGFGVGVAIAALGTALIARARAGDA